MTAKTNTFGDLNSVKKEIERIYSQIDALEKEKTKWDKMGDKKRVKYYDDLIKDNEHKIKTFQKVISDVEKMEKKTKKTPAKKTSAKKTAGTTRTKGLHQTGTQTLAGKSMDAKIRAALPGKRTSATGKTYYEYRVNRTDMPTERSDFEKLFGKVKRAPKAEKKTTKKTPTKKTASGTSKKTAEAIKAELYSTKISLDSDKRHLMRLNELLHNYEVEKARWERMGDKKRVQYNENLIKETKAEILKYKTKIIPALEKEKAKLENEMKTLETKKTSGTAKKKTSGTASASKSAKKKQVKPKTRKTSKTQKTLF